MNLTAKKLREAAAYMKDYGVASVMAIARVRDALGVGKTDAIARDLGAVLEAIADELDELQAGATGANNLRQKLESAENKAERRKKHIGYLNTTLHDKNGLLKQRGGTIARLTAENSDLRKQVPSERERQILDMWPRFEDGEPVWFGDEVDGLRGVIDNIDLYGSAVNLASDLDHMHLLPGERVKRPVQSVLDADGVEIHVGDTVWANASERGDGRMWTVTGLDFSTGYSVKAHDRRGRVRDLNPKWLTHTRPDSWERLEGDVNAIVTGDGMYHMLNNYCNARDLGGDDVMRLTIGDIVRRAKALAGVK